MESVSVDALEPGRVPCALVYEVVPVPDVAEEGVHVVFMRQVTE